MFDINFKMFLYPVAYLRGAGGGSEVLDSLKIKKKDIYIGYLTNTRAIYVSVTTLC